jgi:hypothetical protein
MKKKKKKKKEEKKNASPHDPDGSPPPVVDRSPKTIWTPQQAPLPCFFVSGVFDLGTFLTLILFM